MTDVILAQCTQRMTTFTIYFLLWWDVSGQPLGRKQIGEELRVFGTASGKYT